MQIKNKKQRTVETAFGKNLDSVYSVVATPVKCH